MAPPRPLPLHRFLFRFVRNPLTNLPEAAYREPLVWYKSIRGTVAWVTGPDLVDQILVSGADDFEKTRVEKRVFERTLGTGVLTAEGPLWRWERRIMAPLFRHQEIERYVPEMVRAADEQVSRWRASRSPVRRVDLDMVDTTFAIIARTMLEGGEPAEAAVIKRETASSLDGISWEVAFALLNLPRWLPHPAWLRLRRSSRKLREAVGAIVARRRASAQTDGDDLLSRLIRARDEETGTGMTDEQVIDNLLTLLEAGHETTAKALSWTLYLLARAPEWQDRVRDEIANVMGDAPFSSAFMDRLPVTQQVLKESMRLYPPAAIMVRMARRNVNLGGTSFPPGTLTVIPIFCIHRHRQLWADPDRFDPTRFGEGKTYPRTQFMPFGGGGRICLGSAFAMTEAMAMLATFIRAARFEWDGTTFPEPVSRITLQPKGGVTLRLGLI